MASAHTVYDLVGLPHHYHSLAGSAIAGAIVVGAGIAVRAKLRNEEKNLLPEPKWNLLNSAVEIVKVFRKLLSEMIGPHADRYLPLIVATFVFILMANLSGMLPGFVPATENLNNNFAMAIFVFVGYHFFGFKEHGISYLKHFTGGLPGQQTYGRFITLFLTLIAGVVFVIELVGHIVRPFSLSLRLLGTVTGDHALVGVINGLIPLFIPILALSLGLLVSVIQALVFALLSSVYIKLAVSHDH